MPHTFSVKIIKYNDDYIRVFFIQDEVIIEREGYISLEAAFDVIKKWLNQ